MKKMNLLEFWTMLSIIGSCMAADWANLHIKYDLLLNGYFTISLTQNDLLKDTNWKFMTFDENLNYFSYNDDPKVAIGFDKQGYIGGVRISFIIDGLTIKSKSKKLTFPYTFTDKPLYTKGKYWNTDVYYTTVLFASPESFAAGGRNKTTGILGENVYVKINGKYTKMPRKESEAPSLGFIKQGCVIGMGRHYFLGLSPSSDCKNLQGVYLLYQSQELIGVGLIPFGSFTSSKRVWFEDPNSTVGAVIAPNSPPCLGEWLDNYGASSIHLFFNKYPRLTTC